MTNPSYTWVTACENCGSTRWKVYGVAADTRPAHPVQCRCTGCDLVFANPRLTPESLSAVYESYYSRYAPDQSARSMIETYDAAARTLLAEIGRTKRQGDLLDVGCGTGAFMTRARDAGFEVSGVELSIEGVEQATGEHGLERVVHGTLEDARFPAESFDIVVAWHLIEHVSGVGGFVDEVRRVLRPGGIAVIGTEAHRYPINAWLRALRFATGRIPRPVTSDLHTYVFSTGALRDCFERRGFETVHLRAYDEQTSAERARLFGGGSLLRRVGARATVELGGAAARLTRTGPYLVGSFRRV